MCYEHIHHCKFCNHEYRCDLPNRLCPTVNFDIDARICPKCKIQLERELRELDEAELKNRVRRNKI